jgi:hypothetical protein
VEAVEAIVVVEEIVLTVVNLTDALVGVMDVKGAQEIALVYVKVLVDVLALGKQTLEKTIV